MPLTQKTKQKVVRPPTPRPEPLPSIPDLGLGLLRPAPDGLRYGAHGVSGLTWGLVLKTQQCGHPAGRRCAGQRRGFLDRPGHRCAFS